MNVLKYVVYTITDVIFHILFDELPYPKILMLPLTDLLFFLNLYECCELT